MKVDDILIQVYLQLHIIFNVIVLIHEGERKSTVQATLTDYKYQVVMLLKLPNVTVVIPSFNRANLIYNLLLSLKYQSYPKDKYQIVVVDDFSEDHTLQLIKKVNLKNLTVIVNKENRGPAYSRNIGWKASEGEIIIFCDSDFIVPKTFVENHAKAHVNNNSLAVSGMGHWNHVLTYDYEKQWSPFQMEHLENEYLRPFITKRIKQSTNHNLITEKDIKQEMLPSFLIASDNPIKEWSKMYEDVIALSGYSLKDFQCPWISFCTGNVSIRRIDLYHLGGFDEEFHLGYEDWEFAYRFYLEGGRFCFSKKAEAYLQLTPRPPSRKTSAYNNFKIFQKKHPFLEINLLKLDLEGKITFNELHKLLQQHYQIQAIHPSFIPLTHQFEIMAKNYAQNASCIPEPKSVKETRNKYIEEKRLYVSTQLGFKEWLNFFDKFYYQ